MIKVNLAEIRKSGSSLVILGVDLTKVNIKPLILSAIIYVLPTYLIYDDWEGEIDGKGDEYQALKKENDKYLAELRKNKDSEKKLIAFNKQIEDLKVRSQRIKQILKIRTNPFEALERISRDLPDDMWLTNLNVSKGVLFEVEGLSYSFKSISSFLTLSNDSRFFNRSLEIVDSKTLVEKARDKQRRVESFKIKGKFTYFNKGGK